VEKDNQTSADRMGEMRTFTAEPKTGTMTGNNYESPRCERYALWWEGTLCASVQQSVNTGAFDPIIETPHDGDWVD
jgi:hypothetical protein